MGWKIQKETKIPIPLALPLLLEKKIELLDAYSSPFVVVLLIPFLPIKLKFGRKEIKYF